MTLHSKRPDSLAWERKDRASPAPLNLSKAQTRAIAEWIMEGYPEETCGLLVGTETLAGTNVVRVERARNVADQTLAKVRFEIDPLDWMHIESAARRQGLEVVGIWHSHPDHPSRPSRADFNTAWTKYSYLIARATTAGSRDMRAWRLIEGTFLEQQVIDPDA
jgi:proteasome lid subunit RPN8/RPN11